MIVLVTLMSASVTEAHPPRGEAELTLEIAIDEQEVKFEARMSYELFCSTFAPDNLPEQVPWLLKKDAKRIWEKVEQFFLDVNPVKIDGVPVRPVVESMNESLLPRLWINVSYATKGKPGEVSMTWNFFPKNDSAGNPIRPEIAADFKVFGKKKELVFTDKEPEYVWHDEDSPYYRNILSVPADKTPGTISLPLLSVCLAAGWVAALLAMRSVKVGVRLKLLITAVVLVGAVAARNYGTVEIESPWRGGLQAPDEKRAKAIFKTLHKNIYRAFDYKTESSIYDTLAISVDGQLLEKIYNDLYLSLMQKVLGKAASHIQTVRILESKLVKEPEGEDAGKAQFRIWCCWRVHGSVRHWGHTHARTNEYEAVYTVGVRDGTWKIVATKVIRQEQVSEPIEG